MCILFNTPNSTSKVDVRDVTMSPWIYAELEMTRIIRLSKYRGGNRNLISNKIVCEFTKESIENENLNVLSTLPIKTYWTTNYDSLIEDTLFKHSNKKVNVKKSVENLSITGPGRDAIVYKMHGGITLAH